MALTTGTRIGPYEVKSTLGEGGMGVVYRARDTKLQRDVALKLLPDHLAGDAALLSRFQREAQVLASLNHPNIAQIHGLEDTTAQTCIVMELVEGETLQERLNRGPAPLDEALPVAKQIAQALEAAHEKGVIHRDLKPGNIKISPEGQVKVLDFGLAKALEPGSYDNVSNSPTFVGTVTNAGTILGTSAYMSPEQAKGRAADSRSDIWAFGIVLYEMLAGKPAFEGDTVVEVLGGVLKADPDWKALPAGLPPAVQSLLRRCLQKDRSRRLHAIADARLEIEEIIADPEAPRTASLARGRNRRGIAWAVSIIGAAAVAFSIGALYFGRTPIPQPEMRLHIVTPPGNPMHFAISPDGTKVVYRALVDGKDQLWLRLLESETPRPLPGTENAANVFWSPDSKSIGFFADQKLKRTDIALGTTQVLAPAFFSSGGAWNKDGVILAALSNTSPLYRISETGGQPVEVTRVESPNQKGHRSPSFLPDGNHFLFYVTGTPDVRGVYVGSLDSKDSRRLFEADTWPAFVPPDYALFVRQETLLAQRLDLNKLEPVGNAFPIAERLVQDPGFITSVALSTSTAGTIAYRRAIDTARQFVLVDRGGKPIRTIGDPDTAVSGGGMPPRISPDGRTIVLSRRLQGNMDLWLADVLRGGVRRFTSDAASDVNAVWSPDGDRVVFNSFRKGLYDLYEKPAAGGAEKLVWESLENKNVYDWSPDGAYILYSSQNAKTARDIWALPMSGANASPAGRSPQGMDGDPKPIPVVQTEFEELNAYFSPDGRWIAYQSNESGRPEIYLHPFPGPGANIPVSRNGGLVPMWHKSGREIFFVSPDNKVMAAAVTLHPNGKAEVETPQALFSVRPDSQISISPDGQQFLIKQSVEEAPIPPITIILNWAGSLGL